MRGAANGAKEEGDGSKDPASHKSSPTDRTLVREDFNKGEGESLGDSSPYLLMVESVEGRDLDPYPAILLDLEMKDVNKQV
ncbi:hypothetical protein U1Q18_050160 [Sarracenia purpurea var. burkii]